MMLDEKSLPRKGSMKLKQLREIFNITSKEMARRLGVTRTTYWKNEGGGAFPAFRSLKVLMDDFDISMDWFIFDKGPMYFKEKVKAEEIVTLRKNLELEKQKNTEFESQKQEIVEVKEELERLKAELEQKTKAEKEAKEALAEMEKKLKPEVLDLVDHMEKIPVLHHKVLLDFHNFKLEKKEIVADAMLEEAGD